MYEQAHGVIGQGQVGKALAWVLSHHYAVKVRDAEDGLLGRFDVMHVCYPWHETFVHTTQQYCTMYRPDLVIIHSTVPVGTTRQIGPFAVHSPIRGVHPHLESGIRTFVKSFGGARAKDAAQIFDRIGVRTISFNQPETTELGKILDTTYYGWNIVFAKEVQRICDAYGLDYDEVYSLPNYHYNEGYARLGKDHVVRPILESIPGPIGGHCVIPNCELLDDWLTQTIRGRNDLHYQLEKVDE